VRDFEQPGTLAEMIRRLNAIRRSCPALQFDRGLAFHPTDNPQILCYSKRTPGGADPVLVVVSLDPLHMQHGWVRLPLADWGFAPDQPVEVHDLLSDERYTWRGEWNYVRLAHVFVLPGYHRLQPAAGAAPSGQAS
jgi:starch synthase (maltosyl-transferring)